MAMIETVAVRQQGAYDFETHYSNLCALQSLCPSPAVKAHLSEGVLDINGDKFRVNDWVPILNTIHINKTLSYIAIRSYFQAGDDDDKRVGVRKKTPSVRSKEITYRLCKSLRDCMAFTPVLTCIELQGLPLRDRDLTTLSKGVAANATLTHLSLEHSPIGDDGLDIICNGVKNSPSVTSLNFTGCGLSWKGAGVLATVIKQQAMKRHNEAWQDSLRYRRPDLDRMSGIRRITVNANPMLGEKGALGLAEALKDDLWLKALDMQQCGMNNAGAQALLDVLKYNTTIVVLDVRDNPLIDQDIVRSIMEQVMINCNGQDTEYKWIRADSRSAGGKGSKARRKRIRTLQNSFGKKTTIKVTTGNARRRSKSATSITKEANCDGVKPGSGMPWRTALRADRYRAHPHQDQAALYEHLSDCTGSESPHAMHYADGDEVTETETSSDYTTSKQTMIEMEQLRRRYSEERIARSRADAQVVKLQVENQRLRHQVEIAAMGGNGGSLLDDDRVVDNLEKSFQQFHAFLDMLQEAGLGPLITLAGLDKARMPFNRSDLQASRMPLGSAPMGSKPVRHLDHHAFPPVELAGQAPASGNADVTTRATAAMGVKINVIPDNRRHGVDPTEEAGHLGNSNSKGKMRFDELYTKALRDTDGAISNALAEAERHANTTSLSNRSLDKPRVDTVADEPQLEPISTHSTSQHQSRSSSKGGSTRVLLQQNSNNSLNNLSSTHNGSKSSQQRAGLAGLAGSKLSVASLNATNEEYTEQFEVSHSDISEDIENIQDINDLLPAPPPSLLKGYRGSDEDSF